MCLKAESLYEASIIDTDEMSAVLERLSTGSVLSFIATCDPCGNLTAAFLSLKDKPPLA
jgi:hypothetical protein